MVYNTYVVVMECRSLFTILLSSQEEYAFVLYVANKITSKFCGTQSTSRTAALKSLLHLFLRGAHPIFLGAQYAIRVVCMWQIKSHQNFAEHNLRHEQPLLKVFYICF